MSSSSSAALPESFGLCSLDATGTRRVRLPLKAVDARFEVAGDCASVSLEQLYEFDGPNPVEVIYTFPLPSDACVHECQLRVGARIVRATAKKIEEARQEYQEARLSGRRAALVETLRENLFELRLGNVQPGDAIRVRFAYVMPLVGDGRTRTLRIPTCPGVRYIPGKPVGADGATDLVPDAGRLNPPRIAADDADAALFYCAGTLLRASAIESETHDLDIGATTDPGVVPILLRHDTETPDRDFVLTWQSDATPAALVSREDATQLLCSVTAPDDMPATRGARDIFFLIDASGSMEGANWVAVISAMRLALQQMQARDRVSVDLFANHMEPLTSGQVPADETWRRAILRALRQHQPSGGTEFTMAFRSIVHTAKHAERPVIVVITDGQFGDEAGACEVAASAGVEVHTIGIDSNVNEAVLRKIARRTRGTCSLCSPLGDFESTVARTVGNLLAPTLDRITVDGRWRVVGNPPALRHGQSALVPFRREADAVGSATDVELTLGFSDGSTRTLKLPVHPTTGKAPALIAAKAEITALLDADRKNDAVTLACQHNLLCEGVAYIAVDEAERVKVATASMVQPSQEVDEPARATHSPASMPHFKKCIGPDLSDYNPDAGIRYSRALAAPACKPSGGMLHSLMNLGNKWLLGAGPSSPESGGNDDEFISLPHEILEDPTPYRAGHSRHDQTLSPEACANCLNRAIHLACFSQHPDWVDLVKRHLLPWAKRRTAHWRMLLRLLNDLEPLTASPTSRIEAITHLEGILPFLSPKAAEHTKEFIRSLK